MPLPLFDVENLAEKVPRNFEACYIGKELFLICGGRDKQARVTADTLMYDRGQLIEVLEMYQKREAHAMAVYQQEIVFVVGGVCDKQQPLRSCEGFLTSKRDWKKYGSMAVAREAPGLCV